MTDIVDKLPYVFDLLFDIKTMSEIERIANGDSSHSDATSQDLIDLFIELNISIPKCLKSCKD